jgi:hypothetical protein
MGGIDRITGGLLGRSDMAMSRVIWGGSKPTAEVLRKTFGEALPTPTDIRNDPFLAAVFSQLGVVGKIQRKLNTLSRKRGRVIPAKGTVASALNASEETNHQDLVFVGVDFAAEYHAQEDTLAGVLAHEWGHLVSDFPNGMNAEEYTWEEIFELRRDEEAAADAYAGKMLSMMGYKTDGVIRFLAGGKNCKESRKYHSIATRAAIIRRAFAETIRRQGTLKNMKLVAHPVFSNPFTQKLIAVA